MNWRVVSVGKPSFRWVRDGVAEYQQRLTRFARVEHQILKKGDGDDFRRARLSGKVICLDETGTLPGTQEVARQVSDWELERVPAVTVCIGGADGLPPDFRKEADAVWSLGRMTLMHELALLVWMEQLYRVYTLKEGHPYHRG